MPPPLRKQPSRQNAPQPGATPSSTQPVHTHIKPTPGVGGRYTDALTDYQSRRINRRLEDLERTNPTDIPASSFLPNASSHSGPSSPSISTPPSFQQSQSQKKKQSNNVRRILYGRKGLKDWLDELPPDPIPPYYSAVAPPPSTPPRKICSSCGYLGAYRCPRCGEWSCDRTCLEVHARDGGCGIGA